MPKRRCGRLPENKKQRAKKNKSNHNSASSSDTTGLSNQAWIKSKTASIRTGAKLAVKNPSVLNADVRNVLPMIINNLDTRSFVKLARTCKYMNSICFSSSDIKIPFERIHSLRVHENYEHSTLRIESGKGVFHCYSDRSRFLKKLFKMPFVYIIKFFCVSSLINDNLLMEIRNYFSKFPRVIIRNITGIRGVDNWDALIEFIQDFHVESLVGLRADVPLGVLSFITQNMKRVDYEGHIPDDVILSATSEHLFLHNAAISLSTFKELVKRYQFGLIDDSTVGLGWTDDHDDDEDPFVKACSEMMKVVHVDNINKSNMKPSNFGINNAEETFARLLEKEKQFMKKPAKSSSSRHESHEPLMQNSSIFNSMVRDILPNIINNLNPCSFVRLAKTCKEMSKICFKNKDIQIPCWSGRMHYSEVIVNSIHPASWLLQVNSREYSTDKKFVKKLSRMPFIYHVQNLILSSEVNDSILMEIRNYFSKFPRVVIRCISGIQAVDSCDGLIEFIKDFNVRNVWNLQAEVSLDALSFLTQNMKSLGYDDYVPEDVILSATSKHLNLPNAAISLNTFKELVKRYQSGLIGRSSIGLEWDYDNEDDVDLFVKACSEIMEVVHVEDIDEPDMKPAVIYIDSTYPYQQYFSLLKSDGSIGVFCIGWNKVVFR